MRLKYEKVIHHAIVNNLFGFGYTKKSCNAQGSSKYYLFVTAPFFMKNTYKKHIESITITYLNTILVNIEVIEMDCLFVFLESFLNTVDEDE